ncbi:hypothetical protein HOY82DRAFT_580948 [Tuber indicum]|nr:hypothetical protein HOY82DRAFT_580948 [Tuber indicum]
MFRGGGISWRKMLLRGFAGKGAFILLCRSLELGNRGGLNWISGVLGGCGGEHDMVGGMGTWWGKSRVGHR